MLEWLNYTIKGIKIDSTNRLYIFSQKEDKNEK